MSPTHRLPKGMMAVDQSAINGEAPHIRQMVPKTSGAKTIAQICGSFSLAAIANFTAVVRLLRYIDCLSHVPGDEYA
ncbi:hypothetical protein C2W62_11205 [Candidatus Entotheonella serta]|nr:hypothetical protein C2W62_11205 [Candidatus Entotheonella serta]